MAEEGGWGRAQLFSVGGVQISPSGEQMKIPKIDEDSQNRWDAEEGFECIHELKDDAVGSFKLQLLK